MAKVLLIDDEMTMVQMVTELLREEGHEVIPFSNYNAAIDALETHQPELVITDLYLDKTRAGGLEILQKARALNPPAVVIVVTGYASVESAVEAMKKGAFSYLEKPFKLDEFKLCVQRALSYNEAVSENVYLRKQVKKKYQFNQIVGSSSQMHDVFKMIERVADTDSTILILGESGTGKELVARALHFNSRAFKGRYELHRKIARWTWPLWMYVSVTGVVIYLLLYQIFPQAPPPKTDQQIQAGSSSESLR